VNLHGIRPDGGANFHHGFGTIEIAMRTTIEIPDALLRWARVAAAERRIPLRELVCEALTEKLRVGVSRGKPWMNSFGKLRNLHKETMRIDKLMQAEFGQIEPEGGH